MKLKLWIAFILSFNLFSDNRSLSCKENCQVFDHFAQACLYRTKCQFEGNGCFIQIRCDKWDNFSQNCRYEGKTTQCHNSNPWLPAPSCQQTCQYWDSFQEICLYETQCEYFAQNCLIQTRCERWDNFNNTCLSEQKDFQCP